MTSIFKMTLTELKLFLRDPMSVFFSIAFPTLLIVILGSVPAFREPRKDIGGLRVIDLYVPISITMALAMLALSAVPTYLATYREKGILRRLRTTPVPPSRLLLAQMVMSLLMAVVAVALLIAVSRVAFEVAVPRQLIGFALAFVLSAAALFGIGLVVAALAPNGRAATSIGTLLFFPILFFAGLWIPRAAMPGTLRHVSDFTPLGAGVQALQDAGAGLWPQPLHLAVMAGYVVVFGLVAARFFRWE